MGFKGNCHAVTDGDMEPHNRCGANGNCGNTGFCTGGVCAQVAAGTQCSGFFCQTPTDHVFQPGGTCNGAGTCVIPPAAECAPYKCTTGSCISGSCTSDTPCTASGYCTGDPTTPGVCATKKGLGQTCSIDKECALGHCTEGVCCNVGACAVSCYSCKVSGLEGTCNPVAPGGLDPMNMCPDMGAASCGTNGRCEGGSCQYYDMNTECSTSCYGLTLTHTKCGGPGMCNMSTDETCTTTCTLAGCDL